MKTVCIFAILFVFGASAFSFNDFVKGAGKVFNHPIMQNTIIPIGKNLANQQLAKKGVNIQFAEEAGFMDFMNKAVNVGKTIYNNPIVKSTLIPMGKNLAQQQLQKKGINLQFEESEQAGFMDFMKKAVDVGKQVVNHPVMKDTFIPLGKNLVNQQLAKKNVPIQFAEESGSFTDFLNKAIKVGKEVAPHVLPHIKEVISTTSKLDFKDKNAVLNHFIETGKKSIDLGIKIAPSVAGAIKN